MLPDFFQKCQETLLNRWSSITAELTKDIAYDVLAKKDLRDAIERCVNSKTKSYRYVLPTQLIAKVTDPTLDCRCIQSSRCKKGDFDARSLCTKVIISFDRENYNVLGGSPEAYVNNPLRVPEISTEYRVQQKDKKGWDDLIFVLDTVESKQDPAFTEAIF